MTNNVINLTREDLRTIRSLVKGACHASKLILKDKRIEDDIKDQFKKGVYASFKNVLKELKKAGV